MKRLIIAVDCDDVILPSTRFIADEDNRLYGTSVRYDHAHKSGNEEWAAPRDESHRRIHDIQLGEEYRKIVPYQDAITSVQHLAKHHELHLVTARDGKLLQVTERMLDKYFPNCFTTLEHVGLDAGKGSVCRRLQADMLIDDNTKHLEDADEFGIKNLLWFGDYPWNRTINPPSGVRRCLDWDEVTSEVERIANA